jgi:anthrone oxygenase-like protein
MVTMDWPLLSALEFIATLTAALFAGAAIYINVAEHPARMEIDTRSAAVQWAPSYRRATWMQAPLAIVSFLAGVGAWLLGGGVLWLVAALFIGAVVPITFIVVMPTNRQLLAPGRELDTLETRELLDRWGRQHAIRSVASGVATLLMLWGLAHGLGS